MSAKFKTQMFFIVYRSTLIYKELFKVNFPISESPPNIPSTHTHTHTRLIDSAVFENLNFHLHIRPVMILTKKMLRTSKKPQSNPETYVNSTLVCAM